MTVIDIRTRTATPTAPRPDIEQMSAEYDAALEAATAPDVLDDFREEIAKTLARLTQPGVTPQAELLQLLRGAFARGWVEHAAETTPSVPLANVVGLDRHRHRTGH